MRHWTITTYASGRKRQIDLRLYKSPRELRAAATRFVRQWEKPANKFTDTLGVVHGFQHIRINDDDTETEQDLVAIIRLAENHLTPTIISHEIAHAAQHLYGLDILKPDDNAEDLFTSGNEEFAWITGELFAAVWTAVNSKEKP